MGKSGHKPRGRKLFKIEQSQPRLTEPRRSLFDLITPGLQPFVGAVVLAEVPQPASMRVQMGWIGDEGKLRPVILDDWDGHWPCWSLTSNPQFRGGEDRIPARGTDQLGLSTGWMWSRFCSHLRDDQIVGTIWAAPEELLHSVVATGAVFPKETGPQWAQRVHQLHVGAGWTWENRAA